jgi:hypothetical protein
MVEAVWPAIQKDVQLNAYYHRVTKRKGPNPAKVATARRLLTIVYDVSGLELLKENGPPTIDAKVAAFGTGRIGE